MTKIDWTPEEIDALPQCDPSEMVMVKPFIRGAPMFYHDTEGYRWTVGQYDENNYYKEAWLGW